MKRFRLDSMSILSAALLLSACGGVSRHCVGEFEYQKAQTLPAPGQIEGLVLPNSASALQIPPAPEKPVPYAREVADPANPGEMRTECLDVPPALTIKPEPPEPVPAPAPEAPKPEAEKS